MANINTITPILKERYGPRIVEQLDNYTELTKRITKSSENISHEFGGKYVTFPVHVGRNSGIGSRFESEALPAAGSQKYAGVRLGLKYAYGAIEITGPSVALSETNPQAFAKVITEETDGLSNDLGRDFNRQLFGNGNGAMAYFAGATGASQTGLGSVRGVGAGDIVDIYDASGALTASKQTVLAVDQRTKVITFASSQTTVANGFMTRTGSGPDPVKGNRELTGLGRIVNNSGILYDLDPAVEPLWKAEVAAHQGANADTLEAEMTEMVDAVYANGGSTNLIVTTQKVRRAYVQKLMSLRQTVNKTEHAGGFSGFSFVTDGPSGNIDILIDLDCTTDTMFFLDTKDITLYRDKPWSWLDRDGSMWKQKVTTNGPLDAWRAEMTQYHELGIGRRNTHGKITGITA